MSAIEPEEQRAASREMWERAAEGWGSRADRVREWGMPVSATMVDALALQPGQTVLELAAGPGDTGFMAAELIQPGGKLISSDGAEAMIEVAKARAAALGVGNAEFRQLELEWIDLEAGSVDAVLCRWGIMLIVDPEAAAKEIRRVLKAGGRAAFAVWDRPDRNPWATIPSQAMIELGLAERPDPNAPGMFRLAADGALTELLESAGFTDVKVAAVSLERRHTDAQEFVEETLELSPMMRRTLAEVSETDRQRVSERILAATQAYGADDGSVLLPGSSLVAVASA
jgi:ubiquinone/menaquinone biosynthesis C-methylase UbiE